MSTSRVTSAFRIAADAGVSQAQVGTLRTDATGSLRHAPGNAAVAVGTALVLFGVVFALRLAISNDNATVSLFFCVPIMILTLRFGVRGGVLAVVLALGLMQLWVWIQDVDRGLVEYATRLVAFASVPAAVGLAGGARSLGQNAKDGAVAGAPGEQDSRSVASALTRRETEVLRLLAFGHTNAEIADRLVLSVRTVESHRANLQRKVRRSSRADLVSYALRHGLIGDGHPEQADARE